MNRPHEEEFYVGYMPKAPKGQGRFLMMVVLLLLLLAPLLAWQIARSQNAFGPGTFEYGVVRPYEGWVVEEPFPMLRLERPFGKTEEAFSLYTLVLFGKRNAAEMVAGLQGKKVFLEGTLIHRDDQVMIEVVSDSLKILDQETQPNSGPVGVEMSEVVLLGEIVDSKCFLGVMKPANLKPHKACAIRCISSGIPPVLVVRDGRDTPRYFLLATADGKSINKDILHLVAEPVKVTGRVVTFDNLNVLYADVADFELYTAPEPAPERKELNE